MAKKDRSNLTGRISIRFTPEELEMLDELADEDNERKPSSLCRRIILGYIKDRQKEPLAASPRFEEQPERRSKSSPASSPRRRR
jgi:hypothetical protein